jgi:hypothetical protein
MNEEPTTHFLSGQYMNKECVSFSWKTAVYDSGVQKIANISWEDAFCPAAASRLYSALAGRFYKEEWSGTLSFSCT